MSGVLWITIVDAISTASTIKRVLARCQKDTGGFVAIQSPGTYLQGTRSPAPRKCNSVADFIEGAALAL
jgi:hypothetical protein